MLISAEPELQTPPLFHPSIQRVLYHHPCATVQRQFSLLKCHNVTDCGNVPTPSPLRCLSSRRTSRPPRCRERERRTRGRVGRMKGGVGGGGRGYQPLIKNDAICLLLRSLPFPSSTLSIKGAASPARSVINLPLYYRSDLSLNAALPLPPPPPSCGGSSLSGCHAASPRRPPGSSFPRVEQ